MKFKFRKYKGEKAIKMAKWLPADRVTGRNPWTDTDFGRRFSGSLFTFGPEKDYRPTASRQTRQNVNGVPADHSKGM